MAEEALASFDKRFPNGEDREVVDAREEIGRLQQKIVEYSNQIIDLEADKKRVGGDLSSVIEQRDALDVRIAALTAERDAAREELARQGDGVKGEP
jgi:uncharacterized coiled-coil DUF342 family protein